MRIFISSLKGVFPTKFTKESVTSIEPRSYINGSLELDRSSSFYPKRSDEKVMREDIKALVIAASELISEQNLSEQELASTSLYVANGAFVEDTERYMSKSVSLYQSLPKESNLEEKLPHLYKVSPPLLALITLTNSSMSFVAQYTGIKGNNATYGTTSISFYHALQDAIRDIRLGKSKRSLICAANCAGNYSFLMNSSIADYSDSWAESAAVGCLLIEGSDDIPENAIAEITHLKSEVRPRKIEEVFFASNWNELIPEQHRSNTIFLSGAFHQRMDVERLKYADECKFNAISTFQSYGNLGPTNIFLGISEGLKQMKQTKKAFIVIDKDVYGKESMIRIAHV